MTSQAEALRALLFLTLIGMAWLGASFLRRRRLSPPSFILWGLFALLIPALGPFLVILIKPGRR